MWGQVYHVLFPVKEYFTEHKTEITFGGTISLSVFSIKTDSHTWAGCWNVLMALLHVEQGGSLGRMLMGSYTRNPISLAAGSIDKSRSQWPSSRRDQGSIDYRHQLQATFQHLEADLNPPRFAYPRSLSLGALRSLLQVPKKSLGRQDGSSRHDCPHVCLLWLHRSRFEAQAPLQQDLSNQIVQMPLRADESADTRGPPPWSFQSSRVEENGWVAWEGGVSCGQAKRPGGKIRGEGKEITGFTAASNSAG